MEYIVENASKIMQLCFGFGFVFFILILGRIMWIASRLLRKVDQLVSVFEEYIKVPIVALADGAKILKKVISYIEKNYGDGQLRKKNVKQKN